jgi:hypothetical protein
VHTVTTARDLSRPQLKVSLYLIEQLSHLYHRLPAHRRLHSQIVNGEPRDLHQHLKYARLHGDGIIALDGLQPRQSSNLEGKPSSKLEPSIPIVNARTDIGQQWDSAGGLKASLIIFSLWVRALRGHMAWCCFADRIYTFLVNISTLRSLLICIFFLNDSIVAVYYSIPYVYCTFDHNRVTHHTPLSS